MKKRALRLAALTMALVIFLSGCGNTGPLGELLGQYAQDLLEAAESVAGQVSTYEDATQGVRFSDMVYRRPDMETFEQLVLDCCESLREETDPDRAMETVYAFYDAYDWFCTMLALADIHYSCDLSDTYWEEEYAFCMESAAAADAGLQEIYYALTESPIRRELEQDYFGEDFFLYYEEGEPWSEALLALMEEENRLKNQYYALTGEAMEEEYYSEAYFSQYSQPLTELLVELIGVRQQIAREMGYDSYPEFAYDAYHYRDYTPGQTEVYLQQIGEELTELYRRVNGSEVWALAYDYCSEEDMFDYVKTAAENMGGYTQEAFACLEAAELHHLSYGRNKMEGAFETYLWSYYQPFVFLSPYMDQSDKLSFAHEFGHFANDYVCSGSMAGTDVAEVHSQAMEYLSLLYAEDTQALAVYKLADCLCVYVEQAAYALFEQRVYELEGEDLTVENVQALYRQIGRDFGFDSWDWDPRDLIAVEHFYTNPMYIVSYVCSNDVAFQIYQMETQERGAGLRIYQQSLESMDSYLLDFVEQYRLESPFRPGGLEEVRESLETGLSEYLT